MRHAISNTVFLSIAMSINFFALKNVRFDGFHQMASDIKEKKMKDEV